MKLVVQRVRHANVSVEDKIIGKISNGLYCFYLLFGKDKKK